MTIVPVFTSSVTSSSNAAAIEASFNAAAKVLDTDLKAPVTVTVDVDWGNLDGQAISGGNVSESLARDYTGYSYAQVKSYIQRAAATNPTDTNLVTASQNLPASDPTHLNKYSITTADAKALGLLPPTMTNLDGYVGFSSSVAYDFSTTTAVAGEYDFEGLALHELSEILGRSSGLTSSAPSQGALLDLFRYASPRVNSFNYWSSAYFSINGGKTALATFNGAGGYDRGDWASSLSSDVQGAAVSTGRKLQLSSADLTALDVLGWDATNNPQGFPTSLSSVKAAAGAAVPEPATWTLGLMGMGLLGAALRRRSPARVA